MRVGARELKLHLGHYLGLVQGGETIEITERGKLVARLSSAGAKALPAHLQHLIADGRAIYEGVPLKLPTPIKMSPGKKTAADFVREQRR